MQIRDVSPFQLDDVLNLNESSVPHVSSISMSEITTTRWTAPTMATTFPSACFMRVLIR